MTATARFEVCREKFEETLLWLEGTEAAGLEHGSLEDELDARGREVMRLMYQEHLELRTEREERVEVACAEGVTHRSIETGHTRPLHTIFGSVSVKRLAYRRRGHANLYPADAELNLPVETHSHGLRRLAAVEATRGSFEDASAAVERACGQRIGKRQMEALAAKTAVDVEGFYAARAPSVVAGSDVVVLSVDGKGIVMRPESLRAATAKAAEGAAPKLGSRLSKGEKRYRKRMAEVGAVYDLTPAPRTPEQVMARTAEKDPTWKPPVAANKWVTASVVDDAAAVIAEVFDQAARRDPDHTRTWVALVDGNNHQINRIEAEATSRNITVHVVIDLIHVLEYLWGAAWCFYNEADPAAEAWVHDKALAILSGQARDVAAGIRRRATTLRLPATKRVKADTAATYLTNKIPYLDYPTALSAGWPIATGVIEGACRHLVADRMDITGARWSINGAEAILKLRAVNTNGDLDDYMRYHLNQERLRNHDTRYRANSLSTAA